MRHLSSATLTLVAVAAALGATTHGAVDPHLDLGQLPAGCPACHEAHGVPRSPMLPAPQAEICLRCHDTAAGASRMVSLGLLAPGARPTLLGEVLSSPHTHPIDDEGHSRSELDRVVCTSCHSPHRGMPERPDSRGAAGQPKLSTAGPEQWEVERCGRCHGSGPLTEPMTIGDPYARDIPFPDARARSYHPIGAPARERSASVVVELVGREISCTDCHGNSDRSGPRGPHGSALDGLLKRPYAAVDGLEEGAETYALCYDCHDRQQVLESSPFPLHRSHVVDLRISCASCHAAHSSPDNRALMRWGELDLAPGFAASTRTGRLGFVSTGPGSGACYLTCHGYDHGPATYGGEVPELGSLLPGDGIETLDPDPALGSPSPQGLDEARDDRSDPPLP